jgi:hypothetical protein
VCGIRPQTPGFKTVYIQPYLGKLENIEGRLFIPSFNDYIEINMQRTGESGISGIVKLPEGMTGSFKWKEETIQLISGKQNISLQ